MADYLIQDSTLDAIVDAINAKTGGSSAMTPAQMVTEIGSISTGGGSGSSGYTLIYDDTLAEDVTTVTINFTDAMKAYNVIWITVDSPQGSPSYPYILANKNTGGSYLSSAALSRAYIMPDPQNTGQGRIDFRDSFSYPINYIYIRGYYSTEQFLTGTRIRMWGANI